MYMYIYDNIHSRKAYTKLCLRIAFMSAFAYLRDCDISAEQAMQLYKEFPCIHNTYSTVSLVLPKTLNIDRQVGACVNLCMDAYP